MNLYEKMSAIMDAIQYLGKDGSIDYGKTKYKAISEEKVTTMVRRELIKHKIVVYPTRQVYSRDGNLTKVNVVYRMVNAEDPLDYIEIASSGEGADTQDKGVGKAMTYAYKYMLLRTFGIPTGEDPDKISSAELTDRFAEEKRGKEMSREEKEELLLTSLNNTGKSALDMYKFFKVADMTEMTDEQIDTALGWFK